MTVAELIAAIAIRWPNAWPNKDVADAWARDYRRTLGASEGPELAAAWDRVLSTWMSGSWPKPAAFKDALAANGHTERSAGAGSDEWRLHSVKLAEDFTARKRRIGQDWFEANQPIARQAKAEGWLLALKDWVGEAANLMAQREQKRQAGERTVPLGNRYPWLTDGPRGDEIIGPPADRVAMWRDAMNAHVPRGNAGAQRAVA